MTYFDQLHPWCLIRLLPNLQNRVIARFRRRNDADAHMRVLRQLAPTVRYEIVFDVEGDRADSSADSDSVIFPRHSGRGF
jgi:hypothetical protein